MVNKTLHVITCLGDGGAQSSLFALCENDGPTEHVVVSLSDLGKYAALLEARGITVISLGMKRNKVSLLGMWNLWHLIRRVRPDAIQTWMYHSNLIGGVAARLAGHRNIVWGIHHTDLIPGKSSRGTILVARLCARLSTILPRRIVCCAEKSREVHVDLGYDSDRMRVISNGYNLSVFRPDTQAGQLIREELKVSAVDPLIGFVARYDPQKDHDNLLLALALLQEQGACPNCLLIGTGLDAGNAVVAESIATLNLSDRVRLLGRRDDIPAVMNALDLHVMSSAFGEAFPNVLAEAMACGTPCVATDVGDAAAIVGSTGRIVPPRDPKALAGAIADLLALRGTPVWQEKCEAAQGRVADLFSIQQMVRSYQDVWSRK